jgi:hypothetical protein
MLSERLTLEPLHHNELLTLRARRTDVMDRADIGVIERRSGAGLTLEPFVSRRVLRQLGGKKLERDAAPQPRIFGLVDPPAPSLLRIR